VIAVDAPGFGASEALAEPQDYLLPRLADFTLDLLDTLGLEQTTWLGASWGAERGRRRGSGQSRPHLGARPPRRRVSRSVAAARDPRELRAYWLEQPGFRYADWDELFAEAEGYFGRWSPALEASARSAFSQEAATSSPAWVPTSTRR
jgi:pimeloyl-ACP methyl ester carboxylesterase